MKASAKQQAKVVRGMVLRLRTELGKAVGKPMASREATGRLLQVSPATVFNWERGLALPGRRHLEELRAVLEDPRLERGGLTASESTGKKRVDRGKIAANSLAVMLQAIAACGSSATARRVFDRACEAIGG